MRIIKSLIKWFLQFKLLEKVGLSLINYDMLKYVSHYLWVFKLFSIPKLKIIHNEKKDITDEDIHLCERLLKTYKGMELANAETEISPLWASTLKSKHGKLTSALESGNPRTLSLTLSTMFKEHFVYGLASGDLVKHSTSVLGSKIWSVVPK